MTTNNLISTPNITGNIGVCSVSSDNVLIADNFFTSQHKVVQVNSCTGEVITSNIYTDYSGLQVIGVISALLFVGIFAAAIANN